MKLLNAITLGIVIAMALSSTNAFGEFRESVQDQLDEISRSAKDTAWELQQQNNLLRMQMMAPIIKDLARKRTERLRNPAKLLEWCKFIVDEQCHGISEYTEEDIEDCKPIFKRNPKPFQEIMRSGCVER